MHGDPPGEENMQCMCQQLAWGVIEHVLGLLRLKVELVPGLEVQRQGLRRHVLLQHFQEVSMLLPKKATAASKQQLSFAGLAKCKGKRRQKRSNPMPDKQGRQQKNKKVTGTREDQNHPLVRKIWARPPTLTSAAPDHGACGALISRAP